MPQQFTTINQPGNRPGAVCEPVTVTTTEDAVTIGGSLGEVEVISSAAWAYHTRPGQALANMVPVAANTPYRLVAGNTYYIRAVTGSAVLVGVVGG
jgi:hypothetical protein